MNDRRQNIMKRDMKVEDESMKPCKILVCVIRLQVSNSVIVIQGADEIRKWLVTAGTVTFYAATIDI